MSDCATPRVIVMRGIPGSGKTRRALTLTDSATARSFKSNLDPAWHVSHDFKIPSGHPVYRLNRDELRTMMFGHMGSGGSKPPTRAREKAVIAARNNALRALLASGATVVLDDTNLRSDAALRSQVREAAGTPELTDHDILIFDVDADVEECVRRDLARPRSVGEQVIRKMAAKRDEVLGLIPPPPVYDAGLEDCVIVDIDGTLAHMTSRGPFEWHRVGEDDLDKTVAGLVATLAFDNVIVLVSGRDEDCREQTEDWLSEHAIPYRDLHMRPKSSMEDDRIVKERIYREHVEGRYNVRFILDDRDKVVRMWRRLGLKVLQVAEGNF